MKGRLLVIGMAAMAVAIVPNLGVAAACVPASASCVKASDSNARVIEPIATRSSALPIYDDQVHQAEPRLGAGNIVDFQISAISGVLKAVITTEKPMPVQGSDPLEITNAIPAPYAGVHAMVMFQSKWLDTDQTIGLNATGDPITWYGTTGGGSFQADTFRWFLYYGQVLNHRNQCGLGYYDPTGRLVSELPVPIGQLFFVVGQDHEGNSATCTLSNSNRTVTIQTPYSYTWTSSTAVANPARAVRVVGNAPGCTVDCHKITNASAFTWMDHEIGGPPPVGLILGWTWYTDAVPANSYRFGLIAGDPNPGVIPTERCTTNALGGVPELGDPLGRGWSTVGPCTIPNPVGTGFLNTGLNIVAT